MFGHVCVCGGGGGSGPPSQGPMEEKFKAETIHHCRCALHIPIFETPRILATALAWRSYLETFFYYILALPNQLRAGLISPTPVSVNVRGQKEILVQAKGHNSGSVMFSGILSGAKEMTAWLNRSGASKEWVLKR